MGYSWRTGRPPADPTAVTWWWAHRSQRVQVSVDEVAVLAISTANIAQELNVSHPEHAETLRAVAAEMMTWVRQ